jgi:hypothetical protein
VSKRRQAVLQRRQVLLTKIADQRVELAELGARWQTPLYLADQAVIAVRFVRAHPLLVGVMAGLVVVQRRGVRALLKGGWRIWKTYRLMNVAFRKITARL